MGGEFPSGPPGLPHSVWGAIQELIASMLGKRGESFVVGKVIKNNDRAKLVWLREFGDIPIPLVSFNYVIRMFDETPRGTFATNPGLPSPFKSEPRRWKAEIVVPRIGDTVLVAQHLGAERLPKCLGVILTRPADYVVTDTDE